MLIIGLRGRAGAGKNTAVHGIHAGLCSIAGRYGAVEMSFAAPLKDLCADLYGINRFDLDNPEKKNVPYPGIPFETPRAMLQQVGCALRDVDQDVWVRKLMQDLDKGGSLSPVFVTDVRFPNEAAAISARGGVIVEIVRPGLPADTHRSEHALVGAHTDFTVINDGTLEHFYDECYVVGRAIALEFPDALNL